MRGARCAVRGVRCEKSRSRKTIEIENLTGYKIKAFTQQNRVKVAFLYPKTAKNVPYRQKSIVFMSIALTFLLFYYH